MTNKEVIYLTYNENDIGYDLEVIEYLMRNGTITREDARFMRHYLESLNNPEV